MNTKGIGLGLVISEHIVKMFHGTIDFQSVPEQGSTFRFTFKLNDERDLVQHIESFSNEYLPDKD